MRLVLRRIAMTLDNHEQGLDYAPLLDANPIRATLRFGPEREIAWIPFALLLGLAGGLWLRQRISEQRYRSILRGMLWLMAAILVLRFAL